MLDPEEVSAKRDMVQELQEKVDLVGQARRLASLFAVSKTHGDLALLLTPTIAVLRGLADEIERLRLTVKARDDEMWQIMLITKEADKETQRLRGALEAIRDGSSADWLEERSLDFEEYTPSDINGTRWANRRIRELEAEIAVNEELLRRIRED